MSTPAVTPSPDVSPSPDALPVAPAGPEAPAVPLATPAAGAVAVVNAVEARELAMWQRKLLPFMIRFIVVTAIAFFALSGYNVYELQQFIASENSGNLSARVEKLVHANNAGQALSTTETIQQSLLVLEGAAMESRYRQASGLLMSRIWTRQLAFLTGMVLAFLGSVFILGKLSEAPANVSFGTDMLKGAISSTSPGLILAFFGTTLMGISLVVQPPIEVQDKPLYFTLLGLAPNPNATQAGSAPQPSGAASKTAAREDKGAIDIFKDVAGNRASSDVAGGGRQAPSVAGSSPPPIVVGSKPPVR